MVPLAVFNERLAVEVKAPPDRPVIVGVGSVPPTQYIVLSYVKSASSNGLIVTSNELLFGQKPPIFPSLVRPYLWAK